MRTSILNYLIDQGIEDLNNVKLILVAESYGGLVAAQLALENNLSGMGISIAGLITVRTPWEGVSLVQAIPILASLASMIPDAAPLINEYSKCEKALETLNPDGSFIQSLKSSDLGKLTFPILALAGKDLKPTFPYGLLLPFSGFFPQILDPYAPGNDGLVPINSATAANSNKGANFKSHVLSDFPHFGKTTNHTAALGLVKSFVEKIVK